MVAVLVVVLNRNAALAVDNCRTMRTMNSTIGDSNHHWPLYRLDGGR